MLTELKTKTVKLAKRLHSGLNYTQRVHVVQSIQYNSSLPLSAEQSYGTKSRPIICFSTYFLIIILHIVACTMQTIKKSHSSTEIL